MLRTDHRPFSDSDGDSLQARYFNLLNAGPEPDRLIAGIGSILGYLHDLGIRRLRGDRVTWRMVRRWRREAGFPMLPSPGHMSGPRYSSTTSRYAVLAWVLSRQHNGKRGLFTVWQSDRGAQTDAQSNA
jgi:hypothetical protein